MLARVDALASCHSQENERFNTKPNINDSSQILADRAKCQEISLLPDDIMMTKS